MQNTKEKSRKTSTAKKPREKPSIISKELQNPKLTLNELLPFDEKYDFIQAITEVKNLIEDKDTDWNVQVGIINYLRRLLKYNNEIFNNIFYSLKFHFKTFEFLDSFRSVLSRSSLILMSEIFSIPRPETNKETNKQDPLCSYVGLSIPKLISKAFCNQSFIQKEALDCLKIIKEKMIYFPTLVAYIKAMESKKNSEVSLAYESALFLVEKLGQEEMKKAEKIAETVRNLHKIFELKKDPYPNYSAEIMKKVREVVGEEAIGNALNSNKTAKEQYESLVKYVKKPPKKELDKEGFKKFIKQSKEKKLSRSGSSSSGSSGKNALIANLVNKTKKGGNNLDNIKKNLNINVIKPNKENEKNNA